MSIINPGILKSGQSFLQQGQFIILEANGRISSTGGIAPNSNVEGNIRFTGSITANTFTSSGFGVPGIVSATNINLSANGTNGGAVVVTNSPLRFRSYTTADRANIVATAGDIIYNSTTATVQYYNGTTWVSAPSSPDIISPFMLMGA